MYYVAENHDFKLFELHKLVVIINAITSYF